MEFGQRANACRGVGGRMSVARLRGSQVRRVRNVRHVHIVRRVTLLILAVLSLVAPVTAYAVSDVSIDQSKPVAT